MSAAEPTPIRSALEIARGYANNVQAVGIADATDPDKALQLAIAGGAGKIQAQHAEMAATYALVSIAESLAEIARTLRSGVISTQGVEV